MILVLVALQLLGIAQSDMIPLGSKQYRLLDRLDIKLQNDPVIGFSAARPFSRKLITERVETIDSIYMTESLGSSLSKVDLHNMQSLMMNNSEWLQKQHQFKTYTYFRNFYRSPAHMSVVKGKDHFFTVDPIIGFTDGKASTSDKAIFRNTRGLAIRAILDKRIGFYSYLLENQERVPKYVNEYVGKFDALPGMGFIKTFKKTGFDYFDGRGGITFNSGKHIDMSFAFDRLFIGNGYRSLFLSDFSAPYLFLKIDTRFWKLHYQNIFAELIAPFRRTGLSFVRPKKYLAAHYLTIRSSKWLTVGLFENVMFSRKTGFEFSYLNPVIFYRSMEQHLGSADKANFGIDLKANIAGSIQLYGQLMINEFFMREIRQYSKGSWFNKHAAQLGGKYIDAFKINNLDLLAEMNIVRPFTFAHRDSVTSYSHYNQPLAHPLGAGFREFIVNINYQPRPKWYLNAKLMTWKQGLDSAGKNFGSNIFRGYDTRPREYGYFIGTGIPAKTTYASVTASYELFENMFLELNATSRKLSVPKRPVDKLFFWNIGLRMNTGRREYEF